MKTSQTKGGTLKEITIEELAAWIKKNPHVTWGASSWGRTNSKKPGAHRGKYISFRLDTRDMKIFRLELSGMGEDIEIDFRDPGTGTLLDKLDQILAQDVIS